MVIILIGPGVGFPHGTATTARTTFYARGLHRLGHKVLVLCLGPSESPAVGVLNHSVSGTVEGVEYEYTSGTTLRGRNPFHQLGLLVKGISTAFTRILACGAREGIDAILFYSHRGGLIPLFWLTARLARAPYILESCEEPFHRPERSRFWTCVSAIYTHALYRCFDGAIVISDHLHRYVRARSRRGARIVKIPILVDTTAFAVDSGQRPIDGRYIAYSGMLNEAKDGVLTLMQAFRTIGTEWPELRLVLIGDSYTASQIPTFRAHAERLGIAQRVVFTGLLPRDAIPAHLIHAEVLALARPASRQAEAGFPTKLGEYLATGRPVVMTSVGEVGAYLSDGENVFLSPPDDVDAFADRLRFVLSHPDLAAEVGRRGREAAQRHFSYEENARALSEFVRGFRQRATPRGRDHGL
jgi:glycosyltransferase involved in cell wall biosynthesis